MLDQMYEPVKQFTEPMLDLDYVYMTKEEGEKLSILQTDIKAYVDQMEAKWLLNGGIEKIGIIICIN